MPAAAPAVLLHLLDTQQGDIQHYSRNDSTRCRKACIFTPQKTLRENTCTIASGDYSTPVSQRRLRVYRLSRQIQFQQALQNFRIGHFRRVIIPAIGLGDGFIEGLVSVDQPSRFGVV